MIVLKIRKGCNFRKIIKIVFYTNNEISKNALRRKYCVIFPSETYQVNIWISKNENFYLNILKLKQCKLEKDKIEQIREAANDVYEELGDNDSFFNEVYNPNVREIKRDFSSADFIVLYNDVC